MGNYRNIKLSSVIHVFAMLHALVAVFCRVAGVEDELLLTILTMTMLLIICYKKELTIEFTAAIIIVGNIIGFLMGTVGANLFELVIKSPYLVYAISTTLTTEVLGWSIVAITKLFKHGHNDSHSTRISSSYLKWLLLAAGGIFVIRLGIMVFFSNASMDTREILAMANEVITNSIGLTITICMNIIYIRYSKSWSKSLSRSANYLKFAAFMLGTALIETIIVGIGSSYHEAVFTKSTFLLFVVSLIAQITAFCLVYIINYALTARSEMQTQKEKAHLAQYRYIKLKGQVNPHFLFNSLNILDCLVCEEKTEQASTYIHKLAGIYRYMIKSEDEELVPLSDELTFVGLYVDLLMVRFPEGFSVEIDVPEEMKSRYILPCSLQLLLENATKHNAVTVENPLNIRISTEKNNVVVSNNIIPKMTKSQSTGLGQKYIRQQYMDISGKEIKILQKDEMYYVSLPLL